MTVAQYVNSLVPPLSDDDGQGVVTAELGAELESLALELPILPSDFSRADIYDDD
jgi:hypothetical protein